MCIRDRTCERAKLCAICARGIAEPEQEPVAWANMRLDGRTPTMLSISQHPEDRANWVDPVPLYTHPVDDTALLRQALEALVAAGLSAHKTKQVREQAITALRERLEGKV